MADNSKRRGPLVAPKRSFPDPKEDKPKRTPKIKKSTSAKRKRPKVKRRSGVFGGIMSALRMFFRMIWWTFSRLAFVGCLIFGGAVFYYFSKLPSASVLMDDRQKGSVTMLDTNGKVFAWRGDQFGGIVTSETVSTHLKNAVIATEDKRFYGHLGISPRGIAGAIRTNLREGRKPWQGHGGSTITQQIAKRVYFEDLPALERKIKEMPMAVAMELKYSKDEILAVYLNRAFLGSGSYGFEAASQRYFGKSASEVKPSEAAMLAGLLKAPSAANPIRNLKRAQNRANLIVGLMENQGYLTQSQAERARTNPAVLSKVAADRAGGYFADWILDSAPEFIIKDANADVVIKTTFNKQIQVAAEEALATVFQKLKKGSNAQGAIVVMSRDGAVRAMVGGRDANLIGGFNRATQALRQTGSSFKPFVYAAALESGYRYDDIIRDSPIKISTPSGPWEPKNSTENYLGDITLTEAFAKSINTVAVKASEDIGRARVRAVANDFGIENKIADVPSLALGAAESTLLEMTGAYAGVLNGGISARPYGLIELTLQGDSEPLLGKEGGSGLRVINRNAADQLTYMMNQVIENGTGTRASLGERQAAGKTGTTSGARDAWFIGFTAQYVTGVWMGYDDNRKLTGVTGGGMPADIWRETMTRVHANLPLEPLSMNVPKPRFVETGVATNTTKRKKPESIENQIKRDLKQLEKDASSAINKLIKGIFGGGKN